MIRRAIISRVIRVQRRYAVRIRPMESITWAHFGQIFELFIELYKICSHFSHIESVLRIHSVKISLIFINYELSMEQSTGLALDDFFGPIRGEKSRFSWIWKTLLGPEKHSKTHTWTSGKTPVLRELRFHVTRRAVVSRVIRVQRRYAVRIQPIQSVAWAHFGQSFELFIELYRICTHLSYIEYVLRIRLVKIS